MSNDKVRASDYGKVRREERDIAGVLTVTIDGRCVHGDVITKCERDHGGNAVPGPTQKHSTTTKVLGTVTIMAIVVITGLFAAWGAESLWLAGLGWLACAVGVLWTAVAALAIGGTVEELRK
ncbi:hypothetical protein SALGADO_77 [Arthrobacter phage Salgado]|uniref:Uncharacterized protein n=1 Tax=Arthrobacter phage Salgado TaxID=1772314 RepID=A0A0U4KAG2_9CAUD|nr:hypothetical protein KMD22_gp77 [Arthrobacter phage Salgado]ALY10243.1 hypothetical protein SALGADO_77 [Arthrobacter phage Salgado]